VSHLQASSATGESPASGAFRISWMTGALITLGFAAVTFGSGRTIWPAPVGAAEPPPGLVPFFIGLSAAESVLFGLGVCFIVFGYRRVARAGQPLWLSYATYLAVAWLMLSWWPHDNLHRTTLAGNWTGLLAIDYGFHLTLMASIAIVALFAYRALGHADRRA
jgi:hypothetical protein